MWTIFIGAYPYIHKPFSIATICMYTYIHISYIHAHECTDRHKKHTYTYVCACLCIRNGTNQKKIHLVLGEEIYQVLSAYIKYSE